MHRSGREDENAALRDKAFRSGKGIRPLLKNIRVDSSHLCRKTSSKKEGFGRAPGMAKPRDAKRGARLQLLQGEGVAKHTQSRKACLPHRTTRKGPRIRRPLLSFLLPSIRAKTSVRRASTPTMRQRGNPETYRRQKSRRHPQAKPNTSREMIFAYRWKNHQMMIAEATKQESLNR